METLLALEIVALEIYVCVSIYIYILIGEIDYFFFFLAKNILLLIVVPLLGLRFF